MGTFCLLIQFVIPFISSRQNYFLENTLLSRVYLFYFMMINYINENLT
ncbi:MAG: TDP-N-acetylfucosamine:lipid II N-acetylfucosaminyltransferase [Arsenophonus sp.]